MVSESASTAWARMAVFLSDRPLYLSLVNMISKVADDWWKLCRMHTLDTSRKHSRRSDVALLNAAPSSRARSRAGTISPPGKALTAAPMAVNRSIARPLVRNFRPLRSAVLVTGFLNQPKARSEEHTSELQSLMRISYAVFCLKKINNQ